MMCTPPLMMPAGTKRPCGWAGAPLTKFELLCNGMPGGRVCGKAPVGEMCAKRGYVNTLLGALTSSPAKRAPCSVIVPGGGGTTEIARASSHHNEPTDCMMAASCKPRAWVSTVFARVSGEYLSAISSSNGADARASAAAERKISPSPPRSTSLRSRGVAPAPTSASSAFGSTTMGGNPDGNGRSNRANGPHAAPRPEVKQAWHKSKSSCATLLYRLPRTGA